MGQNEANRVFSHVGFFREEKHKESCLEKFITRLREKEDEDPSLRLE